MTEQQWYWSLRRNMAVPASERDKAEESLGPYPSKAAAENWKEIAEARAETWEAQDEAWEGQDPPER